MRISPVAERWTIAAVALLLFAGFTAEAGNARLPQALVRETKRAIYALTPKPPADAKLAVPMHRQEHPLSCELASLLMALRYRGVDVTETQLILDLGFDPTPKANGVWGDPQLAFVGNIDGRQPSTGYGVYWDPIARIAQRYRPATAYSGRSTADLAREIAAGNPVVVWGFISGGQRIDWVAPSGNVVKAVMGEHARVAIGYTGTADAPTGFYLMDPIYGELYWDTTHFEQNWGALDNGMVVVR